MQGINKISMINTTEVNKLSIIRVSGSSRGKVSRVYGASNYLSSLNTDKYKKKKKKKKKKNVEASYYSQMTLITKQHIHSNNYKKYVSNVQRNLGKRLSNQTLIKVLKAYQKTLLINGKFDKQTKKEYISNNLEGNLIKQEIAKSTIHKILKNDSDYSKKLIKKEIVTLRDSRSKNTIKKKVISENTLRVDANYFTEIISFSYSDFEDIDVDRFIEKLNKKNRILSDSLVRNIIEAYTMTIGEKLDNSRPSKRLKEKLEKNLERKGVHPDTIKILLQLDNNFIDL